MFGIRRSQPSAEPAQGSEACRKRTVCQIVWNVAEQRDVSIHRGELSRAFETQASFSLSNLLALTNADLTASTLWAISIPGMKIQNELRKTKYAQNKRLLACRNVCRAPEMHKWPLRSTMHPRTVDRDLR